MTTMHIIRRAIAIYSLTLPSDGLPNHLPSPLLPSWPAIHLGILNPSVSPLSLVSSVFFTRCANSSIALGSPSSAPLSSNSGCLSTRVLRGGLLDVGAVAVAALRSVDGMGDGSREPFA